MVLDTRCPICQRFDEDGAHLFLKCKLMENVCCHLGLTRERYILLAQPSARDVIEAVMKMKVELKLMCCFALWLCWADRNRVREGEQCRGPAWIVQGVLVRIAEKDRQKSAVVSVGLSRSHRWEKPAAGHVKVNCDEAFEPGTGNGGWGCVLRDQDGDVVMACCGRIEALLNPLQGELIACIQGVQAAIEVGVGHVVVESDAVAVVQAVYSSAYDLSAVTHLVAELRSLLSMNFISWVVQQSPRSCNRVATN